MEQMKRDENLGQGQESDIILLLWQQREESFKQLKDLEFAVTESNIQPSNAKDCLKVIITLKNGLVMNVSVPVIN